MVRIARREYIKSEGAVRVVIEHEDGHTTDHKIHVFNTDKCAKCGHQPAGGTATRVDVEATIAGLLKDAREYELAWADFAPREQK